MGIKQIVSRGHVLPLLKVEGIPLPHFFQSPNKNSKQMIDSIDNNKTASMTSDSKMMETAT